MKRIIAILLCLIMAVGAVACNKTEAPAETTQAPVNENPTEAPEATEAPVEETEAPATEAPVETTEAVEATTEAVVEAGPSYEWNNLSAAEQAALKAVMPISLPDFSTYEIVTRAMAFDLGADDYVVAGNSKGSTTFVGVAEGAVYGCDSLMYIFYSGSVSDMGNIEIDYTANDIDNSTEKSKRSKFRFVDILIFLVCLVAAFIFWCYALYVDDPVIEKTIVVNFVLENAQEGDRLNKGSAKITVYGEQSLLTQTRNINVTVDRSQFDVYNQDTTVTFELPENFYCESNEIVLQLTNSSNKQ